MQGNLEISGGSSGSGSTSPGGADTQVQFNDSGSFGGDAGLTFNKTTNTLTITGGTISGSTPTLSITGAYSDPTAFINAAMLRIETSGSGNLTGDLKAINPRTTHAGTGTANDIYGTYSDVRRGTGAGAVDSLIAAYNTVFTIGSGGTVANAYGTISNISASGGTGYNITQAIGSYVSISNFSSGARIPTVYGMYVTTDSLGSDTDNTYAYYVGTLGGTNQWAFYNSQSQAPIYTAGDLKVDGDIFFTNVPVTDPSVTDQVWSDNGTLKLSGATSASAFGVDRVVETGTTITLADTHSVVVVDYFAIEGTGTLILEGDAAIAVI